MYSGQIPYEVKWAEKEDWKPTMMMIWKTFMAFEGKEYTNEGIRNFFRFITDDDLYQAFLAGTYRMAVVKDSGRIIGAGSIRNGNHLSLLFVDEEFHHKGIGSRIMGYLCDYLEHEEGERFMSLKAAPYAVDFYRKLGFKIIRPEEEYSGIRVTSMEKFFDRNIGVRR